MSNYMVKTGYTNLRSRLYNEVFVLPPTHGQHQLPRMVPGGLPHQIVAVSAQQPHHLLTRKHSVEPLLLHQSSLCLAHTHLQRHQYK